MPVPKPVRIRRRNQPQRNGTVAEKVDIGSEEPRLWSTQTLKYGASVEFHVKHTA